MGKMENVCEPLCTFVHSGGTDAGCNLEMHQFSFWFIMKDTNVPLNPHHASTAGDLVRLVVPNETVGHHSGWGGG
jgi:hypothetical protein